MGRAEAHVELHLKKQSEKLGFYCWKLAPDGTTGIPDRLLVGHHAVTLVETKSPVGKRSPRQEVLHRQMEENGVHVETVYTRTQVDELLTRLIAQCPDNHTIRRVTTQQRATQTRKKNR